MARTASTERTDWYAEVTAQIVSELEALQVAPKGWKKPWTGLWKNGLPVRASGDNFTGINVWLLVLVAAKNGYTDPRWFTFDQAMEACGFTRNSAWKGKCDTFKGVQKWNWAGEGEAPKGLGVNKGEKGTHVVRVNPIPVFMEGTTRVYPPKATAPDGVKLAWKAALASGRIRQTGSYVSVTSYVVFNAQQITGLKGMEVPVVDPAAKYASAALMLETIGAKVVHVNGLDMASYSPTRDIITLPEPGQFSSVEDYWGTCLHEVIHWTGHASRLDRTAGIRGTDEYAREELVAELGAAFLCAHLGIEGNLQHPEYLSAWIRVLNEDSKAVVKAASAASKAMNYILSGGDAFAAETDEQTAGETTDEQAQEVAA